LLLCEVGEKAALDRPIEAGACDQIRKHVTVFMFVSEFCDFEEMREEFGRLSAFDLALVVNALEDDEVLVSQLVAHEDKRLCGTSADVPLSRFQFPEQFLMILARQRQTPRKSRTIR
jgi:hypothetical protein